MPELPFTETSQQIAKEFLNTVVLIDDRAYLGEKPASLIPDVVVKPRKQGGEAESQLLVPRSMAGGMVNLVEAQATPPQNVAPASATQGSEAITTLAVDHTLNVNTVIDAFGKIGIVCAVVRPLKDELAKLKQTIKDLGPSADIIILDWVLYGDQSGAVPLELVSILASTAKDAGARARLVVVYTAEADLGDISAKIRNQLNIAESGSDPLTTTQGGLRICVYGKEGLRPTPVNAGREVTAAQLPETIVAEFAHMTRGLLSNMAIKSITAIRANTYQLLSRFRPELDASFVTHGTLISPEQASEQIPSLIVSEIREILDDMSVSQVADYGHVSEWIKYQQTLGLTFPESAKVPSREFEAGLLQLIRCGIGEDAIDKLFVDHPDFSSQVIKSKTVKKYTSSIRDTLTAMLLKDPSQQVAGDAALAMLMSLRHRYDRPMPQLALGSIVSTGDGDKIRYLLCLQPVCDSVRLDKARSFPFIPLNLVDDPKICDLVIEDRDVLRFVTLKYNPYVLEMIAFEPTESKVIAKVTEDDFVFQSKMDTNYRWIAELKPAHAQRVANLFANTFSRVGLDESEWGRLGSRNLG
jgi:hypothetical protein